MAYSNQRVVSDGTLVTLALSINYLDRAEISVLFNGVVSTAGWSWVGATDNTISFNPAVAYGTVVTVQRTTDIASIRNNYVGGAAFNYQSIDANFTQVLQIAQEARENSAGIADVYTDLNLHGNRVVNLKPGAATGDAVEYSQLQEAMEAVGATAVGAASAAQASANTAVSAATSAAGSAVLTGAQAAAAVTAAGNAQASASLAAGAAGLAANYASLAYITDYGSISTAATDTFDYGALL